jgi:hypothetical protein
MNFLVMTCHEEEREGGRRDAIWECCKRNDATVVAEAAPPPLRSRVLGRLRGHLTKDFFEIILF